MNIYTPVLEEILLVDDNSFINFYNKNTLLEMGIAKNVHVATDGFEALNYLKECKDRNTFPELILLDIIMPMVDGTDFIKWVRMLDLLQPSSTKIVALTGGGNDSRIEEIAHLGLDDIIYKPLNKLQITKTLQKLFCPANVQENSPGSDKPLPI